MVIETYAETGAVYYDLVGSGDVSVARTVHLAELAMVDLDETTYPVGIEFAAPPTDDD